MNGRHRRGIRPHFKTAPSPAGPQDGGVVAPGFLLDLEALRRLFDAVEGCGWSTLAQEPEAPFLWIDGDYEQHPVRLRIRMHPPDDEGPGMKWDRTGPG